MCTILIKKYRNLINNKLSAFICFTQYLKKIGIHVCISSTVKYLHVYTIIIVKLSVWVTQTLFWLQITLFCTVFGALHADSEIFAC